MLTSFNTVCFLIGLLLSLTLLSNHEASTLTPEPSSTIFRISAYSSLWSQLLLHISVPFLSSDFADPGEEHLLVVWANSWCGRQSAFERDGPQGSGDRVLAALAVPAPVHHDWCWKALSTVSESLPHSDCTSYNPRSPT